MSVVIYPAVLDPEREGVLTARFADFHELVVSATAATDLLRAARERLGAELQHLERQGETWPDATTVGSLAPPPGGSILLVDVSVDDTPIRLSISLGERLLKRIDQDAQARSMTRSGYLALGARRMLGEAADPLRAVGGDSERLKEEIAALGRRVNEAVGPDSAVSRTLAELDALALEGLRRIGGEVRSAFKARGRRNDAAKEPAPEPPASE